MPMVMVTPKAMAMMMAPPTAVARCGAVVVGLAVGVVAGVGVDVVVMVDVVMMLLVAARLTRPSDHAGCLAGIIRIGNIPVTLSWRRQSESVSR